MEFLKSNHEKSQEKVGIQPLVKYLSGKRMDVCVRVCVRYITYPGNYLPNNADWMALRIAEKVAANRNRMTLYFVRPASKIAEIKQKIVANQNISNHRSV